jgi:gingipain R
LDDRGHPRLVVEPLLIIVSDDSANGWDFREDMDALVQWKRQRGQQTILTPVRVICDPPAAAEIHEYIGSMYTGEPHVSHVLLVGDSPQIPSYIEPEYDPGYDPHWPAAVADPTYTLVSGDDIFPDVFVGRFSASIDYQVQTQVQRTIAYERDLGQQGAQPWLEKAFGLATNHLIFPPGPPNSNVQWMEARMDELEQLGYTERHAYERVRYDHSDGDADYLSWALNDGDEGVGVLLSSNHGEPRGWGLDFPWPSGFKVPAVRALTNWNRLPIIHAHSCDLGNFAYTGEDGVCFAEAWMWQKNDQWDWPGGAVATYMASRELRAQGPQWAQRETVEILSAEPGRVSLGRALYGGVLSLITWLGPDTEAARANFIVWTVFGDPSLSVRTAAPTAMTVSHGGYFHSQSEQYVVGVQDGGGSPLAGAWVAVYADESNSGVENGVLCGTGITGYDGRVAVALDQVPNEATSLLLTVTARDRVTYCGTIVEGAGAVTEAEVGSVPGYQLGPIWPIPATDAVYVKYSLGPDRGKGRVSLNVYDVAGRRVRTLIDGAEEPGAHMLVWDGRDEAGNALQAGTYFCRLVAGDRTLAQRVVVLK